MAQDRLSTVAPKRADRLSTDEAGRAPTRKMTVIAQDPGVTSHDHDPAILASMTQVRRGRTRS
jgi:hypothetical protein